MPSMYPQVSYVELLESTSKRRQALKDSYFFDCDCSRCVSALLGESSDDWFLDGLACSAKDCSDGVIVVADPVESIGGTLECRVCGKHRECGDVVSCQQRLRDMRLVLKESRRRADSTELEQWQLYQQLWQIVRRSLRAHPKSTLVATTARDIGNFLMDADAATLSKLGDQPPRALPFFLDELRATEWVIPDVHLPSRGLLHFQIAKLIVEEVEQRRGAGYHQPAAMKLIEDADRHIKTGLSVYVVCRPRHDWSAPDSTRLSHHPRYADLVSFRIRRYEQARVRAWSR